MKTILVLLVSLLALPFSTAMTSNNAAPLAARESPAHTITLTADQVTGARDIEMAIEAATANGTRPGKVILDGSQGDFFYTADDKSINLYYSNVTLRGQNGATIANCDDGVFFDDFPIHSILIEEITFVCRGSGVAGWGGPHPIDRVIIRKNTIHAQSNGIEMGAMTHWNILRNYISAGHFAVHIIGGHGNQVAQNKLYGFIGVFLHSSEQASSTGNRVLMNDLQVAWQGVLLGHGVDENRVQANYIVGPQVAGIAFEGENEGNIVTGNKVACAPDAECLVVDAYPEAYHTNKIKGNTYFQSSQPFTPGEIKH